MQSYKKTLLTAVIVGVIAGVVALQTTPGLPESCREFREKMKQMTLSENGLAGVVASVPERALDQAIGERYAAMTADQCAARTPEIARQLAALAQTPWAAKMPEAAENATSAVMQCHDKRVNGALKTHAESVQCSNPQITLAFAKAGYPYMDLVTLFTDKRIEEAQKLDKAAFGTTENPLEFAKLALEIADQERKRISVPNK